jgi:hypothetical protein
MAWEAEGDQWIVGTASMKLGFLVGHIVGSEITQNYMGISLFLAYLPNLSSLPFCMECLSNA